MINFEKLNVYQEAIKLALELTESLLALNNQKMAVVTDQIFVILTRHPEFNSGSFRFRNKFGMTRKDRFLASL